jgi:hypothetical protein
MPLCAANRDYAHNRICLPTGPGPDERNGDVGDAKHRETTRDSLTAELRRIPARDQPPSFGSRLTRNRPPSERRLDGCLPHLRPQRDH